MPSQSESFAAIKRGVYSNSLYFLGKDILGYSRFCETQLDWDEWLRGIFTFFPQKRAFAMKLAPRETFKSTFFVVTLAIHALIQNPELTILIVGETQGNADAHLKEIKSKLESERFKAAFGDWTTRDTWRDDAINIAPRRHYSKEASIETAGLGKSLTGKHYDLIIGDDLVGLDDRDSAAKRDQTFQFFNSLFDVLKKDCGQLIVDGTRWHREDLYGHIISKLAPELERKGLGKFHVSVVPAHDKTTGAINYPRLLPERRLQELRIVKQGKDGIDITTFMAQYELDPLSPEEQVFKTLHYFNVKDIQLEYIVQWTDPALSEKATACYSAIVVLGKVKGENWLACLYASMERRAPAKIKKDHNRIAKMHQVLYAVPVYVYMEENGFQLLLCQQANEEGDIETVGRPNRENKLARIRSMEPFVSQGFIRFRDDWEIAPEGYRIALEQLLSFPQGQMDGPDALQSAHAQSQRGFSYCRTVTKEGEQDTEAVAVQASMDDNNIIKRPDPSRKQFNFLDNV